MTSKTFDGSATATSISSIETSSDFATRSVDLHLLSAKGQHGLAADRIVETILAITKHIYTGDNTIELLRYAEASELSQTLRSVCEYHVESHMSSLEISNSGRQADIAETQVNEAEDASSTPSFASIAKQIALTTIHRDNIEVESEDAILMKYSGFTQHQIICHLSIHKSSLQCVFRYLNTQHHQNALSHIIDTMEQVCQSILYSWSSAISTMSFLGPCNMETITKSMQTPAEKAEYCLHDILIQQAECRPDSVAIDAWDGTFTYAELYQQSIRMATNLLERGVTPQECIPMCMEKSRLALVAMFGTFLAGATCVPFDIRAPQQRIETLIQRLGARFVVADQANMQKFEGTSVVVLTCTVEDGNNYHALQGLPKVAPSSVAFIYFTSGSTGIPKGVVLEHGNLYATILELIKAYSLDEQSRLFQYASYVFDVSMGDNFGTLAAGGCLCIPSEEQRLSDPTAAVHTFKATHACFTNTVISQMFPEKVPTLQHLFVGGEALDKAQFLRWKDHVEFNVVYGTTETLIWDVLATSTELMSDSNNLGRVTIGPCLWVVDPNDPEQLRPVGAIGEILIEGPTLARGYMDDPKTTAAKFIGAPQWLQRLRPNQQTRAYRSGDMGFVNANGSVTFAGRADTQVKLRGQRIELGEIEHNIRLTDESLGHVVVEAVMVPSRGDTKTLAAFFHDSSPSNDEGDILPMTTQHKKVFLQIQQSLMVSLPQYMVPSLFIPVRELPRAVTGKLDRKTLKKWAASIDADDVGQYYLTSATFREPETVAEKWVRQIWATVLKVPEASISAEDHFFQVGGDSIKAMELVAILRERGNIFTVDKVFQTPRLCEMASGLGSVQREADDIGLEPFSLIQDKVGIEKCLSEVAKACGVSNDSIADIYPTSPIQEALMAISAHRPKVYRQQAALALPKSLNIDRFKSAIETLVSTQAVFRTRIVVANTVGSVQAILRYDGIAWRTGSSLEQYTKQDMETTMTYGNPLSRFAIIEESGNQFFVWTCHHSVYDAWSRTLMYDEIHKIYEHGVTSPEVPYSRFIQYVTERRDTEEADEFWRAQFPDVLEGFPFLPSPEYTPQPTRVQSLEFKVPRRAGSAITTATVIQGAWSLVTARQAGTNDALFGLPLSGRDAPILGVTNMMAPTVTTVPMRINIDNTMTVSEYLQHVQEQVSGVKAYQHTGLQRIRHLSAEASSAVAFKNLLVIHPSDEGELQSLSKLGLQVVSYEETDSLDLPLTLQCTINTAGTVTVKAHYDAKILPEKQLECLLHQLKHIISQLIMESTSLSVYDLDMMSPHDLKQYAQWHAVEPKVVAATLHGMFKSRVIAAPNAVAISGFDGEYSYKELDSMSDQLAHHLLDLGVGPESRVVLSFGKSTWPIVAMMAILKCGGTCCSVNPDHPDSRILEICEDVGAEVLLCDERSVARFANNVDHVIAVNSSLLGQLIPSSDREFPEVLPSNASFIVYTSGSTGKPKGSVLEHQNLCTSLTAIGANSDMNSSTRTLQFSAYTFDAHILEIFGTLIHGGCICVISDSERMDKLGEVIHQRQMNWSLLTPTVARLLVPEKVPSLRTLILSGEPLAQRDMDQWVNNLRLLNGLGPSECSILACITDTMTAESHVSNIGIPIGCRVWITDRRRPDRLVPLGCTGELILEGPILGRGYVNRAKATAAAFIKDPLWSRDGSGRVRRFYRTGDLARLNLDYSISFVGRADTQVKIRGQRVELGEIEHKIKLCGPNVEQVAVEVVKISSRGDTQVLTAFISCRGRADISDSTNRFFEMDSDLKTELGQLQAALANILPRYMVPSLFLPVKQLPISPSGKLERKTLRQWACALESQDLEQYFLREKTVTRPPQTENEHKLHKLWAQVLKIPQNSVGLDDNFFALGGDSVTAMEMIAVARGLGISLSVADVFRLPRLHEMSQAVKISANVTDQTLTSEPFALIANSTDVSRCIDEAARACQVDKELVEDIYPATPIQEGLLAVSTYRRWAYTHQAVFELPSSLDIDKLKAAWETLVAAQPIFRTRIIAVQDVGTLQVILRSKIDWLTGSSLEQYLELDQTKPMTHGTELSRWGVTSCDDKSHFIWTVHHSIYDGWSLMKVFDEVRRIYQAGSMQNVVPYNNFVRYLTKLKKEDSEEFWRQQLPDLVESYPQLPAIDYKPVPRHLRSSQMAIPARKDKSVTMASVIQAAWALLITKYTGDDAALFGLTLSGRDVPVDGITEIMGPTLTTIPMRIPIDSTLSVADYLQRVQKQVANVRQYQHTGLQHIRRLSPQARAAVDFQNLLVVQTVGGDEIASSLGALGLKQLDHEEKDFLNLALTLECIVKHDSVQFNLQFDEQVIPQAQTERLLSQLQFTISSLLDQKLQQTTLLDVDLVSATEVQQLVTWNDNLPPIVPSTVHGLVEFQAQTNPSAVAIRSFDGERTYGELNAMAESLAAYLVDIGVGPEMSVMLCFTKSSWSIIAQLAVLKAGGCCVSVLPEHPASRLSEIFKISEPTVMLCDKHSVERFSDQIRHVVPVDSSLFAQLGSRQLSSLSNGTPTSRAQSSNMAFIIYTSGSTGKPKGVVLEHGSLSVALQIHTERTMKLGAKTTSLQYAAYSFDASIMEIFGPLSCGGCICVISDDERMDLERLSEACNDRGVNWAFLTPSVAKLLSPKDLPALQTIVVGGEMLPRQVIDIWSGHTQLLQAYGPSETSIFACYGPATYDLSNIGFAGGSRLWVVEKQRPDRLVPIGCIGELVIEGPLVGRGYLKNPQATDTAFIIDPAWSRASAQQLSRRMYRSGDLVRMNADGSVRFIGRMDTQVKIHGQRVELSEIEFKLQQTLPPASEVIVEIIAALNKTSEPQVVAFVKLQEFAQTGSNSNQEVDKKNRSLLQALISDLEQSLGDRLPQYMIPSVYIPITEAPTTVSGKTDRKYLKEYAQTLSRDAMCIRGIDLKKREPTNEMEKLLQSIWSRVLNCPDIGIDDTFMSLGGDSITAMQVVTACRKANVKISVSLILSKKTIYAIAPLCASIKDNLQASASLLDLTNAELGDFLTRKLPQIGVSTDNIESVFPCTATQEGILLSQQRDRGAYRVTCIWQIKQCDATANISFSHLERAWQSLVSRHSTLRTGIHEEASDNCPFIQVVLKKAPSRITESKEKIEQVADIADAAIPMQDTFWSHLPRLTVYHVESGAIACRLDACHTMIDGASLDLLISEYVDNLLDKAPSTPKTNYENFVRYERGLSKAKSVSYWTKYLGDMQPCHLPVQKQSGLQSVAYGTFELSENATKEIASCCKQLGVTPATLIQAAWSILLGAFTGKNDVCFGYLASDRDAPVDGIETGIGLFISMQLCRVLLAGSVDEILHRIQDDIIEGLDYRHCSLASIHNALGFRDTPLFNTCLTLRRGLTGEKATQNSSMFEMFDLPDISEYAIALNASVDPSGVEVAFSYQCSEVSQDYANSIGYSLETIIRSITANPKQLANEVDLLSPNDHALINKWNKELPVVNATVHELFELQAYVRPDTIAISSFDGDRTYAELNALATKLATHLLQSGTGVGPEVPVVLCFRKSTWAIVSMLAVLKAGSFCISINPEHPTNRLLDLCDDAEASVLLCDRDNLDRFAQIPHVAAVDLSLFAQIESQSNELDSRTSMNVQLHRSKPQSKAGPDNPAFVIYTSGSTGKPKGVILEHRAVSTALMVHSEKMMVDASSRVLQFAAYTFDASIFEIFAPLVKGGCTCLISDDERMNNLAQVYNERSVTWSFLTPSVLKILSPSDVPTLKTLVAGGELVSKPMVQEWCESVNFLIVWGPSECSIFATYDIMKMSFEAANIGSAVACRLWVVEQDRPDRLVPVGCVGELLVEGPALSRGYLNNPQANSAFVTDLAWSRGGETRRFYRSGDLARMNYDGSYTFVGRADTQVKIHGQRVELNEIEYQLQQCLPPKTDVVVEVIELNKSSERTLTAFIKLGTSEDRAETTDAGSEAMLVNGANHTDSHKDPETIRRKNLQALIPDLDRSLHDVLPQYMVPSAYIPVGSMPSTVSGKTDRRSLKLYAQSLPREAMCIQGIDIEKRQPSNETEKVIQSIWAKVLNVPAQEIGIDDTFTSIGGDSITAIQVVIGCRKANIQMSVALIFKEKTIRAIAPFCVTKAEELRSALSSVDQSPFDLSPIQKVFFTDEHSEQYRLNQSFLLRIRHDVSKQKIQHAFDLITSRHEMLRARFKYDSGEKSWKQMVASSAPDCYRFVCHTISDKDKEIQPLIDTASASIDPVNGPVFSIDLFEIAGEDAMLFMAAHHLVIDLVSWRIIWKDLEEVLNGSDALDRPALSFRKWCEIQKADCLSQESMNEVLPLSVPPSEFEFWQVPQHENTLANMVEESVELSPHVTSQILGKANSALRTAPLDIMLGFLTLSFSKAFPERSVPSIMLEHHGRDAWEADQDLEIDQTVGWFTSMYPLHVPVDCSSTAFEAIRLVKDLRSKVPGNGRPYFACRHLSSKGDETFRHHGLAEMLVNQTGIFQQLEQDDSPVQLESRITCNAGDSKPENPRWSMIDVEIDVKRDVMKVSFQLNRRMAHLDRVRQWIQSFKHLVSEEVLTLATRKPTYTLSDFPSLDMSYDQLNDLLTDTLPQSITSSDNIQDILPLAPYQKISIEGNMLNPPRQWDSLFIDLPMSVDMNRLTTTCKTFVDHFDIMRTIFVKATTGEFLQVVLKNLQPRIDFYESKEDVQVESDRLCQEDLMCPRSLGTSFLRFIVLTTPSVKRLIIRLSHAQYDGYSCSAIVDNFAALYENRPMPRAASYTDFVHHIRKHNHKGYNHWRLLLGESHLTVVPQITQRDVWSKEHSVIRVNKEIPKFAARSGQTAATVFAAACALLLSSMTGSSDVLFGRFASGRAALDSDLANVVGPCLNVVPVRVQLKANQSLDDMLTAIQVQSVQSSIHETVGLEELIEHCAKGWSKESTKHFPVIMQYLNVSANPQAQDSISPFNLSVWDSTLVHPFPQSLCLAGFPSENGVVISASAGSGYCDYNTIEKISTELCEILARLVVDLEKA